MNAEEGEPSGRPDRDRDAAASAGAGLFDRDSWEALAGGSQELSDNPQAAGHLVYRFLGKYLPTLLAARTEEARERVWLAFWSYLIARASMKKPFGLSQQAADELIERFQRELVQRGYRPRD